MLASAEEKNPTYTGIEDVLKNQQTDVRVFGKPTTRPYRRMAVVLTYDKPDSDVISIKDRAISLSEKIRVVPS